MPLDTPRVTSNISKRMLILMLIVAGGLLAFSFKDPASVTGPPMDVKVQLGSPDGARKFTPGVLNFDRHRLYRLVISNPSNETHYFSSPHLAASVDTRKVVTSNAAGLAVEVKGLIQEIEVFPGGSAEWWFVPVLAGTFEDLHCHSETDRGRQHAELGMTAKITIN